MKIVRYLMDVVMTYLIIQVVGLVAGFMALGLKSKDLANGMVIGFMITSIPTIIYSVAYVTIVRSMLKSSRSLIAHILMALGLTILIFAGNCILFSKDKVSLTDAITWRALIPCFIAASCAAVFMWVRTKRMPNQAGNPGSPRPLD